MRKLGLRPGEISTQILPPEPLAYYLHATTLLSGSFGQLGRDCRQLMRSEIKEVEEEFEEGQVGSSTMAYKRNPINWEKLEGMYMKNVAEYMKVMMTLVSEHQRDLVGSSVSRDFPIIIVNIVEQLDTLLRKNKKGVPFLARMSVNESACKRNFDVNSNVILAEPFYIALQIAGYEGDAHHVLNHSAVPLAKQQNCSLMAAIESLAQADGALMSAVERIPVEVRTLLDTPEAYVGNASANALQIADWADERVRSLEAAK